MKILTGEVDGNQWEELVHKILKIKFSDYTEVPAKYDGDLGIEGFTRSGVAFQCYCPDGHPTSDELYERQRNKITQDIKKLIRNEDDILNLIRPSKIHTWRFVTPKYESKDLIKHCRNKEELVRECNCKHVEVDNFNIELRIENNYTIEIQKLHKVNSLTFDPKIPDVDQDEIEQWKKSRNQFYSNLENKLSKVIQDRKKKTDYIHNNIEALIKGEALLDDLNRNLPDFHEELTKLINSWEQEVQMKSNLGQDSPKKFIIETSNDFRKELVQEFEGQISNAVARHISMRTVSYWLCQCPLNF
ncbi:hypothetical protein [Fodinibius sp. Rm-B-1B1-1]|uniref:hypothetical protein n=1 Tax=Fodinibius alkaliphilus TaxID=3140241 RepID=UPI00315AA54E